MESSVGATEKKVCPTTAIEFKLTDLNATRPGREISQRSCHICCQNCKTFPDVKAILSSGALSSL